MSEKLEVKGLTIDRYNELLAIERAVLEKKSIKITSYSEGCEKVYSFMNDTLLHHELKSDINNIQQERGEWQTKSKTLKDDLHFTEKLHIEDMRVISQFTVKQFKQWRKDNYPKYKDL